MSAPHYDVECPTCGASPGKQCCALTSGRVTDTHVARIDAQYPRCRDCGLLRQTHPIDTCREFVV